MKNRRTRNLCISLRRQLQGLVARPSLAEPKVRLGSLTGISRIKLIFLNMFPLGWLGL